MDEVKLMQPQDVERMFARMGELTLDVSDIRRKFLNCPYGEDQKQMLDIYLPNEGGPFPIIFYAHGGGWAVGSKSDTQLCPFIGGVTRGYAVVSLGYRLIPHILYPENLFDIKAAMRWVTQNAETYLLDPTRTALCGSSAGAHLTMMAAFTQGQAAFEDALVNAPTCSVLAVVNQFGPTDFTKIHKHYDESGFARARAPDEPHAVDTLLGIESARIENLMRFINPIDNVHPGIPPVLIQHGKYDPIIPYQQGIELYDKITEIGGTAEIDISEEFLHADPGYAGKDSVERIFGFLDKYLKPVR